MSFDKAIQEIEAILNGEGASPSEVQLKEIGQFSIDLVIARTRDGIDADHKPFAPYSEQYAKVREARGRSTKVDLVMNGDMQAAMTPVVNGKEVDIGFLSEFEAKKAEWHSGGIKKTVPIKTHSRLALIDTKTGRRVTQKEAAKDKRRKSPRVTKRIETVKVHERHMNLPKRDFIDIRHDDDVMKVGEVVAAKYIDNIKGRLK